MSTDVRNLFDHIWQQYVAVTPSAQKIHQLLGNGNDLINDHVAYRTLNIEKINIAKISAHLVRLGYVDSGDYIFAAKKLVAKHFEHQDSTLPKVFISELLVEEFSDEVQVILKKIANSVKEESVAKLDFLYSGKHWDVSYAEYQLLLKESEYAAWFAAWGYRANHFTVSVNHLESYSDLQEVNEKVKNGGFPLNISGGEIKGNEEVKLEQSSTMADQSEVSFSDKKVIIPSCFYEFAKRYPLESGELYSGFVAASADKIFESTNN